MSCKECGSFAINHNQHGRDGSDADLCDVCFWRKRAAPLVRLTEEEVATIVREAAKGSALNRDGGTSQRIANAIMDAMIAKNGGKV